VCRNGRETPIRLVGLLPMEKESALGRCTGPILFERPAAQIHIKRAHGCADKKGDDQNVRHFCDSEETRLRKKPIVGTIVGIFSGALDGVQARLIRRTKFGYTVELLESRGEFHKGDRVHLSVAEFQINAGETP
jgi:hypothetical protein